MKTSDTIQLVALGLAMYLAYEKFNSAKPPPPIPNLPVQPSTQLPDFGVSNPADSGWGDAATSGLQNVIYWGL
jgi:hypothetical protein